jgi:hypothetical protein
MLGPHLQLTGTPPLTQIIRLGTFAPCDAPVVNPQLAVVHRMIAPINCDPAPSPPLSYTPTLPQIRTPIFVPRPLPTPLPIPTGPVFLPPACDIRPKPLPLPVIPIIAPPACEKKPKPTPQPVPVTPVAPACDKPVPSPAPKPLPVPPVKHTHSGPKRTKVSIQYAAAAITMWTSPSAIPTLLPPPFIMRRSLTPHRRNRRMKARNA